MNGNITLSVPADINDDLKQLWLETAGEAFQALIAKEKTPRYLNQNEASKYLGVSVNTFKAFGKQGLGSISVAGITRWDREDLDQFFKNFKHKN